MAAERIMVCVKDGRPIAAFSDRHVGDQWLDAHTDEVDLVFVLDDNHPTDSSGEHPLDYLAHHTPSQDGLTDGIAVWRLSEDVGHVLLHSSPELVGYVYEIFERWKRLPTEDQILLVRRMLEMARHWPEG